MKYAIDNENHRSDTYHQTFTKIQTLKITNLALIVHVITIKLNLFK